jgi:hypothetical protein
MTMNGLRSDAPRSRRVPDTVSRWFRSGHVRCVGRMLVLETRVAIRFRILKQEGKPPSLRDE